MRGSSLLGSRVRGNDGVLRGDEVCIVGMSPPCPAGHTLRSLRSASPSLRERDVRCAGMTCVKQRKGDAEASPFLGFGG